MERPLSNGAVAEERHGDVVGTTMSGSDGCADGDRDARAHDAIRTEHPDGGIGDVYRTAQPATHAGRDGFLPDRDVAEPGNFPVGVRP